MTARPILPAALMAALLAAAAPAPAAASGPPGGSTMVQVLPGPGGPQEPVQTNVIPLWPARSCYEWRLEIPGPPRQVDLVEIQRTPGPTVFQCSGCEINEQSDGTVLRRRVFAAGRVSGGWCVNEHDPPGDYLYDIRIDGRPAGVFRFCAVRVPEGESFDLRRLACEKPVS